ncbi:hypothetical protein BER2_2634 [plant metagenome]|uniref:Uncharacterized protein n=1 Tax=plant metagenome TaxID=1297885 RepID=A0A484RJZ9_9ZZZZ
MRFLLLFIALILAIVMPIGAAIYVGAAGPGPYLLVDEGPGEAWLTPRNVGQGQAVARRYASQAEARDAADAERDSLETSSYSSTLSVTRYRLREGGVGLLLPVEGWLVHVVAPDRAALDAQVAALPFLQANPDPNPVARALDQHPGGVALGILAYAFFLGIFMFRGAAWAGTVKPAPGTPVLDATQLRARLLAVNGLDVPMQVSQTEKGRYVLTWVLDHARWARPGGMTFVSKVKRVELEFDDARNVVRVVETTMLRDKDKGVTGLSARIALFRGVTIAEHSHKVDIGLNYHPSLGWTVRPEHTFRYRDSELKGPFIQCVTGSGWSWRPVITFWRPLGG